MTCSLPRRPAVRCVSQQQRLICFESLQAECWQGPREDRPFLLGSIIVRVAAVAVKTSSAGDVGCLSRAPGVDLKQQGVSLLSFNSTLSQFSRRSAAALRRTASTADADMRSWGYQWAALPSYPAAPHPSDRPDGSTASRRTASSSHGVPVSLSALAAPPPALPRPPLRPQHPQLI